MSSESWTYNEVFGTTSYARQFVEDLFGIAFQEEFLSTDGGSEFEVLNLKDDAEYGSLGGGPGKPIRCYFVQSVIYSSLLSTQTGNEDELGGASRGNIAALDRSQLVRRFGKGNAFEFCKTMGHELGHTLGLKHFHPPFTGANIMCSEATTGKRPTWDVNPAQVAHARQYGLKNGLLVSSKVG